jgi:hypothetical protein
VATAVSDYTTVFGDVYVYAQAATPLSTDPRVLNPSSPKGWCITDLSVAPFNTASAVASQSAHPINWAHSFTEASPVFTNTHCAIIHFGSNVNESIEFWNSATPPQMYFEDNFGTSLVADYIAQGGPIGGENGCWYVHGIAGDFNEPLVMGAYVDASDMDISFFSAWDNVGSTVLINSQAVAQGASTENELASALTFKAEVDYFIYRGYSPLQNNPPGGGNPPPGPPGGVIQLVTPPSGPVPGPIPAPLPPAPPPLPQGP